MFVSLMCSLLPKDIHIELVTIISLKVYDRKLKSMMCTCVLRMQAMVAPDNSKRLAEFSPNWKS